jgi:hypothetical protein
MSKIKVNGMLDTSSDCLLYYWAPRAQESKYCDNVVPYNSIEQAYYNSSNVGVTTCDKNGMFELILDNPATFYDSNGTYHEPHVNVRSETNPENVIMILLDSNDYIITKS